MKEYTQYKRLREKAGLTVKQVMDAMGVSDATVYFGRPASPTLQSASCPPSPSSTAAP